MARKNRAPDEKPVLWIGSSREDLLGFPEAVKNGIGLALEVAQFGGKHWKGEGSGVLEVVEDYRGDTYRAVYTVRFVQAIYVLHAFKKKSTHGIATSQRDRDLIKRRLRTALADYEVRYGKAF